MQQNRKHKHKQANATKIPLPEAYHQLYQHNPHQNPFINSIDYCRRYLTLSSDPNINLEINIHLEMDTLHQMLPDEVPISDPQPRIMRLIESQELMASVHLSSSSSVLTSRLIVTPIKIAQELVDEFIEVAAPNTTKNLETMGLIAGKRFGNAYHGDTLIVPKQQAQSDSCDADLEEVFKEIKRRDRKLIAWIHTHPQHSQFLSSIDIHQQYLLQKMLDFKLVGIVYAPTAQPQVMGYTLTDFGAEELRQCSVVNRHHDDHQPNYERIIERHSNIIAPITGAHYFVDLR